MIIELICHNYQKMKVVVTVYEDIHDDYKLIKVTYLWENCKHNSWHLKIMWLLKDYTLFFCHDYDPFNTHQAIELHK